MRFAKLPAQKFDSTGDSRAGRLHPSSWEMTNAASVHTARSIGKRFHSGSTAMKPFVRIVGLLLIAVTTASASVPTSERAATTAQKSPGSFEAGRRERVRALRDPVVTGEVLTYYTPGYEQRARDLQRFLIDELGFSRKQLQVELSLSLAVLDAKQWVQVERQVPYPIPSVSGEPPVAIMPASWQEAEGFFPREREATPTLQRVIGAHGLTWREANHRAGDLIGGHELGHAIVDAYGIVPGTHWLNEMLASYVLYAYLQHRRPDRLWLIDVLQAGKHANRPQNHVSLEDFESMYMDILTKDGDNYGWYQNRFLEQLRNVYARHGVDFLRQVRKAFPPGPARFALGNVETLRRLDAIDPSFSAWAKSLDSYPASGAQGPGRLPLHPSGHSIPALPPAAPVRPVTDDYFGTKVVDNYRWMEDLEDPQMQRWMRAQADYTRATLDALPGYPALLERIDALNSSEPAEVTGVQIVAGRYYSLRTPQGAQSPKLYVRRGLQGEDQLLVDPEKLPGNDKSHFSIHDYRPSPDGRYIAYQLASGGSEEGVLHILSVQAGKDLPETADRLDEDIPAPFWRGDSRSFFYSRENTAAAGATAAAKRQNRRVYLHVLGRSFDADPPVFGQGVGDAVIAMTPTEYAEIVTVPGSRYAIALISPGADERLRVYAAPVASIKDGNTAWRAIAASYDDEYIGADNSDHPVIALAGDTLYWLSRRYTPRGEILELDLDKADAKAETVIAQGELPISAVYSGRDAIYWRVGDAGANSIHRLRLVQGAKSERLVLPYAGDVADVSTDGAGNGVALQVNSYLRSPTYMSIDARSGKITDDGLQPAGAYDYPDDLTVEEVRVKSWDGALVPLSIIHKKGIALDGGNLTMITGYGAYGISFSPFYVPAMRAWYDRGAMIAFAHVRGGGELGEAWHKAGYQATKPNTWKDFIACAQYLSARRYTNPGKLFGWAQSAGGILIGRAIEERPDLFGAVVIRVPSADMLRLQTTANGPDNIPEFGDVRTPEGFKVLYAMSPYAHVRDGVKYPPVLIYAGANDQRVAAWIPAKYAARLQAASSSGKPVRCAWITTPATRVSMRPERSPTAIPPTCSPSPCGRPVIRLSSRSHDGHGVI